MPRRLLYGNMNLASPVRNQTKTQVDGGSVCSAKKESSLVQAQPPGSNTGFEKEAQTRKRRLVGCIGINVHVFRGGCIVTITQA